MVILITSQEALNELLERAKSLLDNVSFTFSRLRIPSCVISDDLVYLQPEWVQFVLDLILILLHDIGDHLLNCKLLCNASMSEAEHIVGRLAGLQDVLGTACTLHEKARDYLNNVESESAFSQEAINDGESHYLTGST